MRALFWLLDTAISLYVWALIIAAVLSLLLAFNILDSRNRLVWTITDFFYRITEPALRPIRRILPDFGALDLSPLVVLILLAILDVIIRNQMIALYAGA